MPRLFVALPLPETIRDALLDLNDDNPRLGWVSHDHLHLTLRFIGEVERAQAEDIALALASLRAPPFPLKLTGLGDFTRHKGGVLWAGVAPRDPVATLAARIERACQIAGLPPEHRAFHPHVTLARWSGSRPDLAPMLAQHAGWRSETWTADAFTLVQSHLSRHGAHYEPITNVPMR